MKNSVSTSGTHAILIETVDNSGPQSTIKLDRFRLNNSKTQPKMFMTNPCVGDLVMLPFQLKKKVIWHRIVDIGTFCYDDGSTLDVVFLKKYTKYST